MAHSNTPIQGDSDAWIEALKAENVYMYEKIQRALGRIQVLSDRHSALKTRWEHGVSARYPPASKYMLVLFYWMYVTAEIHNTYLMWVEKVKERMLLAMES